ncbi:MAG: ATP-binding protein [Bacilli bacterium]|nr:ATP-binding protein [Bacilli bacterium]
MGKTKGGVTIKTINGKTYYYFQWYQDGKKRSKSISLEEYEKIINDRKNVDMDFNFARFESLSVLYGASLKSSLSFLKDWEKRDCYAEIEKYISSSPNGKVLVLYGLRRTGKTSLMFQSILSHLDEINKSAYLLCNTQTKMSDINLILNGLSEKGFKYVYIDEITLADDFISSSQFLSDIYGLKMKIVLSGTDSLGFAIASKENLYDRSLLIHTTYIPFKEFSRVLKINDIDKYIEYGGTLVSEGIDYHSNEYPTFYNEKTTMEYVDTAISRNIQKSLENYDDGSKFMRLRNLTESNELVGIINRIVQDNNHRFIASIINRSFKSNDFGSLKDLLRKQKKHDALRTILDTIDEKEIYKTIQDKLDISATSIDQESADELYEYLKMLDVVDTIDVINLENRTKIESVVFTQPGLRYAQAKELLETLIYQPSLLNVPRVYLDAIFSTLLNDVKGRILEEVVILNEKRMRRSNVFKASFLIGEIDMCIDEKDGVSLYEIKHSIETDDMQTRHLVDESKVGLLSSAFGEIKSRNVLYRGPNQVKSGINYINVEDYLKS